MTYEAADDPDVLHMELNTNLVGEHPVLSQLDEVVDSLARYPSQTSRGLRETLSDRHGLPADSFVCSNGADSVLDIAIRALADPGETIAFPWPGFGMYAYFAELRRLDVHRVPLDDDLGVPVDALGGTGAGLVLLANPNNPTGELLGEDVVLGLADDLDGVLVVDEAYIEYADQDSLVPRVADREDLVVVRTLSKAHGLAGLRVGYGAASGATARKLAGARPPFHLDAISEALAISALQDDAWARDAAATVVKERERMTRALTDLGFGPWPSRANFVLAESPVDPAELAEALADRGILIRVFPDEPRLADLVRITAGRPDHTDRLVEALREVLG